MNHPLISNRSAGCVGAAEFWLPRILPWISSKTDSRGGYLCVADLTSGFPLLIQLIGSARLDKMSKYFELCQEKALRLAQNPKHMTSWESRDETQNMYGGAIRQAEKIISFSGLTEEADEALSLRVGNCIKPETILGSRVNELYWLANRNC